MARPLIIVESPAKARTIAGFLGPKYRVEASMGHVRDLPRSPADLPPEARTSPWARMGVDVDAGYSPMYVVAANKTQVVKKLRAAVREASEVYLATDEDREGEAIAWHLREVLRPRVPVRRMVFHEITRPAIAAALAGPRDIDTSLVSAQETRRVLDRLVGWDVSSLLWRTVRPRLSAGRVQSVAVRLVVDRERARLAFRAAEYREVVGTFAPEGDEVTIFGAKLVRVDARPVATAKSFDAATGTVAAGRDVLVLDAGAAEALVSGLDGRPFSVVSVDSKDWRRSPPPPFVTSTLQQEAGRRLRFRSQRTMSIAQKLYERGFITYHRTDSTTLAEAAIHALRGEVERLYGAAYLPPRPRTYRSKKHAQEAHEAIRPAGERLRSPGDLQALLDRDELRLYELIWKRALASQMADALGTATVADLGASTHSGTAVVFQARGRTVTFPGFLRVYDGETNRGGRGRIAAAGEAEGDDGGGVLPPLAAGDGVRCLELSAVGRSTEPPARYTEAGLVKELDRRGIGRPSTYATIIAAIHDRGYVWRKSDAMVPAWVAFAVVQLLEQQLAPLVDYDFTARMESALDAIATGKCAAGPWLDAFYRGDSPGLCRLLSIGSDIQAACRIDLGEGLVVRVTRSTAVLHLPFGDWAGGGSEGDGSRHAPAGVSVRLPDDVPPDEVRAWAASMPASSPTSVSPAARAAGEAEQATDASSPSPETSPTRPLGTDPASGDTVSVRDGPYGPYVQLGVQKKGKRRPPRVSLLASMSLESVTLPQALSLLALPRTLGDHGGAPVVAAYGRYGAYVRCRDSSADVDPPEDILGIGLDAAVELLESAGTPKRGSHAEGTKISSRRKGAGGSKRNRSPGRPLGRHPTSGAAIRVLDGPYGAYVTDGRQRVKLPKGVTASMVDLDGAVSLLDGQAGAKPAPRPPARGRLPRRLP